MVGSVIKRVGGGGGVRIEPGANVVPHSIFTSPFLSFTNAICPFAFISF